jgi:predicted dinucleotide-binding enzyme
MKIAVIGTGNVGGTLGSRWAKAGHEVIFGSRHPESESVQDLLALSGPTATAATPTEAVAAADAVLLATP